MEIVSPYFAINSINVSELKDKNYFYISVVKHKSIMVDCQLPKRWDKIKELHKFFWRQIQLHNDRSFFFFFLENYAS